MTRAVESVGFGRPIAPVTRRAAVVEGHARQRSVATIDPRSLAVLVAASVGAGVIHLALGPVHVQELGAVGVGFYLAAALQLGWAMAAVLFVGRARGVVAHLVVPAGVALNAAILAAWAMSRSVGLPGGEEPWTPEAVGRPDAIAGLLEAAIIVGLVRAHGGSGNSRTAGGRSAAVAAAGIFLVIVGTVVGLTSPDPGHTHAPGHEHSAVAGA